MKRWLTFYLPAFLGLWLVSGTANTRGAAATVEQIARPNPVGSHSALMGNQSSAGAEFARELH
jgi:hypothetical protein